MATPTFIKLSRLRGSVLDAVERIEEMVCVPWHCRLAVAVLILELVLRGYRVIVCTHHHLVLDVVWLIRELSRSEYGCPRDLLRQLGLTSRRDTLRMADDVLAKDCRVYGLIHGDDGVVSKDLSTLDPTASDLDVSG